MLDKLNIENKMLKDALEWLILVVFAVVLYYIVTTYIFRVVVSNGESMYPTLQHKDVLIMSDLYYVFGEPEIGDIVVFPYKENEDDKYIKRVMAKGGDVIDIRDDEIYINDEKLEDDFSYEYVYSHGNIDYPFVVPEETYFVMGDNRNASKDSRYEEVGCVTEDDIMGKVFVRIYPFGNITLFK